MLLGNRLNKGSTIGVVSPASSSPKQIIDKYLNDFRKLGFKLKLGDCLYKKTGYFSGSDEERAEEIMNMFLDPSVDGIVCFRGGYGSIRTLSHIDLSIIKSNPKLFCGYSDITVPLNYFADNGLVTFHGPMIKSDFNDPITTSIFTRLICKPSKGFIYTINCTNSINLNNFSGTIKGGNLSMLCSAIGTPFETNFDNSILFIEEVNEPPYVIDRLITQLLLSNKLDKCNAILIGHLNGCDLDDYSYSYKCEDLLKLRLSQLNIPIIFNVQFGHSYPNITLPIGAKALFDINTSSLVLCHNILK